MKEDLFQKRKAKIKQLWQEAKERMAQQVAEENNLLYINLRRAAIETNAIELVPEEKAREANLVAFSREGKTVKVALFDPSFPPAIKIIEELKQKGFKVIIFVATKESLNWAWRNYRFIHARQKELSHSIDVTSVKAVEFSNLDRALLDIPSTEVTTLVSLILKSALLAQASDIHIEPQEKGALIRFRIDGVLYDVADISSSQYQSIRQRLKLISGLKLNLENIAQNGRFSIQNNTNYVDVRSSSLPAPQGEYFVLRLLPSEKAGWGLADLGLGERGIKLFSTYLSSPNGMILITGPTGSGKTTTLYTLLKKKISPGIKIITIEDPIEYRIPGVNQTQVTKEYTFANGLKSILRQDPDVIMIGEMRDKETVATALQAALTGHLVLSTLHTNEASGAIARLKELGADPKIIPNAVKLIIAQRLVRRLCPFCKEKYQPSPEIKEKLIDAFSILSPRSKVKIPHDIPYLWKAKGCSHCHWLGYSGQIGIFEYFPVSPRIAKAIEADADQNTIRKIAIDEGMVPLFHDGLIKAQEGITSLEEVVRVAGDISYIEEAHKELFSQTLTRGIKISREEEKEIGKILQKPAILPSSLQGKSISKQLALILGTAIKSRATDIHFEPEEKIAHVRERIDGVLHPLLTLDANTYPSFLNEIKVVSGLNTEETQIVQEGRFRVTFPEKSFAIRLSIIPSGYGETASLRVLGGEIKALSLDQLGLNFREKKNIEKVIQKKTGLILAAGPTSSGKTTTLFAILKKLANPEVKIITIEDPIEYRLPGIIQTQVNQEKGYTFAKALRSLLRQNPNIILVGEIRDKETAQLVWQASLTGHLVLSTIHANNALEVFERLESLGVSPEEILPSINMIIAQRLVRKLCPFCKEKTLASSADTKLIEKTLKKFPHQKKKFKKPYKIYKAKGCSQCNYTGYYGRTGIFEILIPGENAKNLKDIEKMRFPRLIDDAVLKMLQGKTSREEIRRVLGI